VSVEVFSMRLTVAADGSTTLVVEALEPISAERVSRATVLITGDPADTGHAARACTTSVEKTIRLVEERFREMARPGAYEPAPIRHLASVPPDEQPEIELIKEKK
jgi:hypothetical protein